MGIEPTTSCVKYNNVSSITLTIIRNKQMWQKWIDNKSLGGQERLSIIMRCLMLRRTKAQLQLKGQLQCLPERSLHQIDVTLEKEEMNVYQKVVSWIIVVKS